MYNEYDYKIWRSYWRIEDKDNYDLHETNHVIPFYTKEKLNNKYDINYLSDYLGELTMMYYIWKNNLKSEYICISQYRRNFYDINFDKLKNNEIEVICNGYCNIGIYKNKFLDFNYKQKYKEYLQKRNINKNIIDNIFYHGYTEFFLIMFCCKWEIFCDICDFIFGFLDYLLPNNLWKDEYVLKNFLDFHKQLRYNETIYEDTDISLYNDKRQFLYALELGGILASYVTSKYTIFLDDNIYLRNNICIPLYNIEDIELFKKTITKNCGNIYPFCIYVLSNDETLKQLEEVKYIKFYDGCYSIPFEYITNINDIPNNTICIDLGIYIKINDLPIEYNHNMYSIKLIDKNE